VIIYAHAYDIFDRGVTWARHRSASDVAHVILRNSDSIPIMNQKIRTAARAERSIYTLIINAHGETDPSGRSIGTISLSDTASLTPITALFMGPLRNCFSSPCNGVELHCCEVLAHRDGWNLCRVLAQKLQVNVFASDVLQRGVSPWFSSTPSDDRGAFEGNVRGFRPNGTDFDAVADFAARGLHSAS